MSVKDARPHTQIKIMSLFDDMQNLGAMLTDDQKADLRQMGERFYGSIDMDKYKPVPKDEAPAHALTEEHHLLQIQYWQLRKALDSGLLEEDLTPDERDTIHAYTKLFPAQQ